jgi:GTPase
VCGTFGFSAAGTIASRLEQRLSESRNERSAERSDELLSLVDEVEHLLFARTT